MTFSGIYAIVDAGTAAEPLRVLDASLAAGIQIVQYRAKDGIERPLLREMLARTRPAGARLIVNDDLEAALEADGWHAGQEDLAGRDVPALRAILGARIFGISAGVPAEAIAAERAGADYVGTGPFAATTTKDDAGEAIGEAGIARVVAATGLPVVAIGGIDLANLAGVVRSGAAMAAVVSALVRAPQPELVARALAGEWRRLQASRDVRA